MDPSFTPLSIGPASIRVMSWPEIRDTFDFPAHADDGDDDLTPTMTQSPPASDRSIVLFCADYAVKIVHKGDRDLSNELFVAGKLNELARANLTHVFSYTSGYVLSLELPPGVRIIAHNHQYVYIFSERIARPFSQLPDEPKINEDFYFEVLIALYYARRELTFSHWDIHTGNLMFNVTTRKPATRSYRISNGFFVTIHDTTFEPKLIDYGKSVVDRTYSDDQWREPRYKKLWNKSDIYHLSLIFKLRNNLSERFRAFLEGTVLPKYYSSMYATRLEQDSAANYGNIEELLRLYFGGGATVNCCVCQQREAQYATVGNAFFCGERCRDRYYDDGELTV